MQQRVFLRKSNNHRMFTIECCTPPAQNQLFLFDATKTIESPLAIVSHRRGQAFHVSLLVCRLDGATLKGVNDR